MVLGREQCLARDPPVAGVALGAEDLLQTLPSKISVGRNVRCEVWPGFWVCVLHVGGQPRSWAVPRACPAPGAPRGCTTSVTSADGAPGAQLGAEIRPLDSPVSAGSAQVLGLQGHTEICEEQCEIQPQPS